MTHGSGGSRADELRLAAMTAARECFAEAAEASNPDDFIPRPEDLERVQRCMGAFARELREAGQQPEQMIVAVKQMIAEVATTTVARNVLARDGVQWAIRGYYRDD